MHTTTIKHFTAADEFELIKTATDYPLERDKDGWISGNFYHCKLTSAFQPVLSMRRNETIGHTAYIRTESNGEIALWPWQVFSLASKDEQLVDLDRLCRAIHTLNYFKNAHSVDKLFLGVHPRLLTSIPDNHGRTFKDFLNLIGANTSQIVIEIPSAINQDWKLLQKAVSNYQSYRYQVAINLANTNHQWLMESTHAFPNIINLNAQDLQQKIIGNHLIDKMRNMGALLHIKKIETPEQFFMAKEIGAHFLQGNLLGATVRAILPVVLQLDQ